MVKKNLPAMQETWDQSLDQEDPLRRAWLTTLVFLPGEFHGQRSLMGYMQYMGCKQSGMTERLTLTTRLRYIIVMNSMSAYSKTLNRKSNNVLK